MANGTTIVPFKEGDIIKDRFTLIKQIGAGTYGAIFAALYQEIGQISKLVAIKFEKEMVKRTLLQNEIIIMRKMDESTLRQILLVWFALRFQICCYATAWTIIDAIQILEQLHRTGFVHRDIKPDNFAIGNIQETAGTIYLLDFGLCKRLCIQDGKVIKPSQPGNFRGTLRYASINAHCKIELGRQDDLISLLYMMVEYFTKKLPWSNVTNPDQILQLKEQSRGGFFLLNMPVEFLEFEKYIFSLDYVDEPDYAYLTSLMYSAAQRNG
ncbi:MAG: putative Tau-tubulin kinase 1, partial [Streblomastix strix]